MKKVTRLFVFFVTIWLCAVSVGYAQSIYVDHSNLSGNEDGSSTYPFNSIQSALDHAETGALITVFPGTYVENLLISKQINLMSQPGSTIIAASNTATAVISIAVNGVGINGFTISGSSFCGISLASSGKTTSGHHIFNNIITNNGTGLYAWRTSGNTIENNEISNNNIGIHYDYDGANSMISGNNFSGNRSAGIQFNLFCGGNTIAENNFTGNAVALKLYHRNAGTRIYHNNFINNNTHTIDYCSAPVLWENGYVSGGNYWDDYSGPDSNTDGIIDQPRGRDFFPVPAPNGWRNIVPEQSIRNLTSGISYPTINAAITEANPGDIIETASGDITGRGMHYENVSISTPITLTAQTGGATITARNYAANVISMKVNGATVNGFTLQGATSAAGVSFADTGEMTANHTISNNVIIGNATGLYAWRTSGNTIENNDISNNSIGLHYYYDGANSMISGNNFSDNSAAGIQFNLFCGGNTIAENNFTGNAVALKLYHRNAGTKIYHNNFINNTTHTLDYCSAPVLWENGYVSGGNYWDDYNGPDSNTDGIIDQPRGRDFFPVPVPNGWRNIVPEQSIRNLTSGISYPTINAAITEANPGDLIEAATGDITGRGMHYENVSISTPITLTAQTGGAAITARNYAENVISMKVNGATLNGFTLQGATSAAGISFAGTGEKTANHTISNNVITGNGTGLYAWRTSGNTIENNEISNNSIGLHYYYDGANSMISGNNFSGNSAAGIQFNLFCGGNTIVENNFTGNAVALKLYHRNAGTRIYHNNFINNSSHLLDYCSAPITWDEGYPSGGNHWDNWKAPDNFSGFAQDVSGADGIVDQPYLKDRFPFVEPNGWNPKNMPPTAIAGPDQQAFVSESVKFDASASWDAEGPIQSFRWTFGDGSTYIESSTNAPDGTFDGITVHAFSQPGSYTVSLEIVDSDGVMASDSLMVTVETIKGGIGQLVVLVSQFGLPHGVENALLAKLWAAQEALDAGDTFTARAKLEDFLSQISAAGFGKNKLPEGFLDVVVPAVTRLLNLL